MMTCMISRFYIVLFFFFKQKTAYEMRICDWSSDVCSSDLMLGHQHRAQDLARADEVVEIGAAPPATHRAGACRIERALILAEARVEIGTAESRERVCQCV